MSLSEEAALEVEMGAAAVASAEMLVDGGELRLSELTVEIIP